MNEKAKLSIAMLQKIEHACRRGYTGHWDKYQTCPEISIYGYNTVNALIRRGLIERQLCTVLTYKDSWDGDECIFRQSERRRFFQLTAKGYALADEMGCLDVFAKEQMLEKWKVPAPDSPIYIRHDWRDESNIGLPHISRQ